MLEKPQLTEMPTFKELMIPILKILQENGGSGNTDELNNKVISSLNFNEEAFNKSHSLATNGQPKIINNLSWARSYLKKAGLIDNTSRGVWTLKPKFEGISKVDVNKIVNDIRNDYFNKKGMIANQIQDENEPNESIENSVDEEVAGEVYEENWKDRLSKILLELSDVQFEYLVMLLLRESGFSEVNVTQRTRDHGIDGTGIAKLQGFLSFHVVFQCKKYSGPVTAPHIRDFRGAMMGVADKGLFITTSYFTSDAIKEASRPGAIPIDLISGNELIMILKKLNLGVSVRMVEEVSVDEEWFKQIDPQNYFNNS